MKAYVLKVLFLVITLIGFANANKCNGLGSADLIEVGDYVWYDKNSNGIQDNGEQGIDNIAVELYCNGNLVDTVTTQNGGKYSFNSCLITTNNANSCQIVINNQNAIDKFEPTLQHQTSPDDDSDAYWDGSKIVVDIPDTIQKGDKIDNLDIGLRHTPVCVGDFVWNDANQDGIYNNSEKPLGGVEVTLYDKDGNYYDSLTTQNDGKYEFCQLYEGEQYYITFKKDGYAFSPKGAGNDITKDSDVNSNGKTDIFTIGVDNNYNIDAGMYKDRYCIGDIYWFDENLNGKKDSNEQGISNVLVELYDENRDLIAQTTTDSNGKYSFCGLKKGKYYVKFDIPDGYKFITKNKSSVDENGWSNLIDLDCDNLDINAGIYCECFDYKVNPQDYDSFEMSNDGYLMVLFIFILIYITFRGKMTN